MGDGGGGHWLVQMEWRPAGWSVYLPLLIFPCTIKSRSSLLAPAHLGGPGKRAVKRLWCDGGAIPQLISPSLAVNYDQFILSFISQKTVHCIVYVVNSERRRDNGRRHLFVWNMCTWGMFSLCWFSCISLFFFSHKVSLRRTGFVARFVQIHHWLLE